MGTESRDGVGGEALARRLQQEDAFEHLTFADLELTGVVLRQKEFYQCTFQRSQFQESQWYGCKFEDCTWMDCDLTRAKFPHTALRGVRFEGSKLMGIDWSTVSSNPEVTFERCVLRYASFVGLSLRKTDVLRCAAQEANFFDLDLTDANFEGTELTGSNFRGCTLTRTDFSQSVGLLLDPARNRLKDTQVPLATAVSLAESLGMRVPALGGDAPVAPRSRKKR
ncbi:MAG: pentapeptide repeat-containing protein [Cystobacter sp.]